MILRHASFFVSGTPIPKGRPRVTRSGHAYTPARTAAWEETVGWAAKAAMTGHTPFRKPLDVTLFFHGARINADVDNLAKAVLDAMNLIVYDDDKQVHRLSIARAPSGKKDPRGVQIDVKEL